MSGLGVVALVAFWWWSVEQSTANQLSAGTTTLSFVVAGLDRTATVYIPPQALDNDSVDLLFVLHGTGGSAQKIRTVTGFDVPAAERGFVVVYPEAVAGDGDSHWQVTSEVRKEIDFFQALLQELEQQLPVPIKNKYIVGMSNGATIAQAAACAINEFVGVVAVAGSLGPQQLPYCTRKHPLLSLGMYGTEDPFKKEPEFVTALQYFTTEVNQCEPSALLVTQIDVSGEVRPPISTHETCPTINQFYRLEGLGHVWPGGQYTKDRQAGVSFSATDTIVESFEL